MPGRRETDIPATDLAHKRGATVRIWRKHRGLTLAELAKRAKFDPNGEGRGRSYLSKVEHGELKPSLARKKQIARALGVSMDDLDQCNMPPMMLPIDEGPPSGPLGGPTVSPLGGPIWDAHVSEEQVEAAIQEAVQRIGKYLRAGLQQLVTPMGLPQDQRVQLDLFRSILRQAGASRPTLTLLGAGDENARQEFQGTEKCMRAAIELVEAAPPLGESNSGEILVTWLGAASLITASRKPHLRREWMGAFRTALERGWHITHLIEISDDREESLEASENHQKALAIVLNILSLLGARGRYQPCLLSPTRKDSEAQAAQRDFVIVPGRGAVEFIGTDRATYYPPGSRFEELRSEVMQAHAGSKPAYTLYDRLSEQRTDAVTQLELHPGDRYLVMSGLSESTVPLTIHRARAKELLDHGCEKPQLVRRTLENRIRRDAAIKEQLETWRFRDLCPEQAIRTLVEKGIYSPDDAFTRLGARPLTPEERKEHLETLVRRLQDHPNYELILLPDVDISICNTYYVAKADYAVILESWRPHLDGTKQHIAVEIKCPAIVRAFYENPLWWYLTKGLPPTNKQRSISFLEEQIGAIKV